jgi:hypothetical protein
VKWLAGVDDWDLKTYARKKEFVIDATKVIRRADARLALAFGNI